MKVSAVSTLLFASLALSSPAPAAQPASGALAPAAEPQLIERAPIVLEARKKAKKPKNGSNNTNSSAAVTMTPNRALQIGALGVGVMEVVRLWG
ncbi:hypothetical protein EK21DRAFT_79843 [Setomelanomma holmii]|uniref:Uncharacterized protein n=1 Tax=Setomelanomma holmii TaxID=210430 RepID=A0A9P4GXR7_9PLEO|nr:hypothetical protein EK21DRAFT_79843 [Setomelanomma holmii]